MEWPTFSHDMRHTSRYKPPPRLAAHAGFDAQVECTSPSGAAVTLDGSHSADKDSTPGTNDDIELFEWFVYFGTPAENSLGKGETLQLHVSLGSHEFTLRVTDKEGNQAIDTVRIAVVDTEGPEVLLNTSVLWPPNHRIVTVTTIVQDVCTETPSYEFRSVESSEPDDAQGLGDGKTTGDVVQLDDMTFELRAERDGAGGGRIYRLVYDTQDDAGNAATRTAEVLVPHDLGGTIEPVMLGLSETPSGTLVHWGEVPGAGSYDVVRGKLGRLEEFNGFYRVAPLTCVAGGITDTTTANLEDADHPALGDGFFYLVGYDAGTWSGYGTESAAKERFVPPGQDGCR